MSNPKSTTSKEIGVQINKGTGGPYVDMREVVESELARIKGERAKRQRPHSTDKINKIDDDCSRITE